MAPIQAKSKSPGTVPAERVIIGFIGTLPVAAVAEQQLATGSPARALMTTQPHQEELITIGSKQRPAVQVPMPVGIVLMIQAGVNCQRRPVFQRQRVPTPTG